MIRVLDFKTEYRVGKEPVDWVLVAPLGAEFEKTQTWQRIAKIKPEDTQDENLKASASYQDRERKWTIIGPAYDAWKNGNAIPEDGTPLSAWSGVTADQAEFMKRIGIRSVEEVRDMGENTIEKLRFPNARKLPELAKKWLEGEQVAEKDAKILELEERMKVMAEMLEEQAKAEKPKRGRPAKKKTEEA